MADSPHSNTYRLRHDRIWSERTAAAGRRCKFFAALRRTLIPCYLGR